MLALIQFILGLAGAYLGIGVVVAAWLHARLARIDPGAVGAGIAFRVLITPGLVALWPLLVRRALVGVAGAFPDPNRPVSSERLRRRHGALVSAGAVLVPLVVGLALAARQEMPRQVKPLPPELVGPLAVARSPWIANAADASVRHRLRSDRYGWHWQVEFEVAGALPFDDALVYWMSGVEDGGASQFIGSLEGTGVRRFAVPGELADHGHFVVVSVSQSRALAAGG